MKIGGREVKGRCMEVLVLPRLDGDIVIKAEAVLDLAAFEALCPAPTAPSVMRAGGVFEPNLQDEGYRAREARFGQLRYDYICLKSLEPSQIEWEKVDLDKPETWGSWKQELRDAGFSNVEIQRIEVCVLQANSLDEEKLKSAREAFLRGQGAQPVAPSGQDTAPTSI